MGTMTHLPQVGSAALCYMPIFGRDMKRLTLQLFYICLREWTPRSTQGLPRHEPATSVLQALSDVSASGALNLGWRSSVR